MATKLYKVLAVDGSVLGTGRKVTRRVRATMYHDAYTETVIVDADGFELAWTVTTPNGAPAGWEGGDNIATVTVAPVRTVAVLDLATADLSALLGC